MVSRGFAEPVRDALKSGEFEPVDVRRVLILNGNIGKFWKSGMPVAQVTHRVHGGLEIAQVFVDWHIR